MRYLALAVMLIAFATTIGLINAHAGLRKSGNVQRSTDYKCLNDCTSGGYMYSYCKRICSY